MMTLEEAGALLDTLAEELPPEFYRELNGGVLLAAETKTHPEARPGDPLYIMGEYRSGGTLGRQIILYYGSFARVLGDSPPAVWEKDLRATLRHEFTHHVESLAGAKGLIVKDERFMAGYRTRGRTSERER
ncbi:MAG: metallopeptidase family protein [Oscillospiraceae bacterium]|jgi:hypothetical protein|nr:metallopeptidase family protein [Oscillospiraceae bacterium]